MLVVYLGLTCCLYLMLGLSEANYVGLQLPSTPMTPLSKTDVFKPRSRFKGDKKEDTKGNDVTYAGGSYDYGGNNGGYGESSAGYGGNYGVGSYGNSGYNYYDMNNCKTKKDWLCRILPIPFIVFVALVMLALLPNVVLLGQVLVPLIGKSNSNSLMKNILQNVDEAMDIFTDVKTDEQCRSRLACELGFVFKDSRFKARFLKAIDFLPSFVKRYLTPLKRAAEDGKNCERYNCTENVLSTLNKYTSGNLKKRLNSQIKILH